MPIDQFSPCDLERLFSAERLSTYIAHCGGDFAAAVEMYRWNAAVTAAFWEPIGERRRTASPGKVASPASSATATPSQPRLATCAANYDPPERVSAGQLKRL